MYDIILFDLDGTVSDSCEGITKCAQYALRQFGIIENDLSKLHFFIGPPPWEAFREFAGFNEEQVNEAVRLFRVRYGEKGINEHRIFPGMTELLRDLKAAGRTLAVATSKPRVYAEKIIDGYGVRDCFDIVMGSDMNDSRSTKAHIIEAIFTELGLPDDAKSRAVLVGDRKYDVVGAKTAGIPCIGVGFGYAPEGELEEYGADYIAGTMDALRSLLLDK